MKPVSAGTQMAPALFSGIEFSAKSLFISGAGVAELADAPALGDDFRELRQVAGTSYHP